MDKVADLILNGSIGNVLFYHGRGTTPSGLKKFRK
jgi:hypothetical protein